MSDVLIQEFNPATNCWNIIQRIPEESFDEETFIFETKYGGPHRIIYPKKVLDFSTNNMVKDVEMEWDEDFVDEVTQDEFEANELADEDRW